MIKPQLNLYSIFVDGKSEEHGIKPWQKALARARRYKHNLFNNPKKIEILNIWTGEIITLEEAEKRCAIYYTKRRKTPPIVAPHEGTVRTYSYITR